MRGAGRRQIEFKWLSAAAVAILAAGWARPAAGQSHGGSVNSGRGLAVASASAPVKSHDVFREMVDPHTGSHWLLIRDAQHPAGPGRLVLASQQQGMQRGSLTWPSLAAEKKPVVHAGDTLVVEEHTALVDARLEAVALAAAFEGDSLRVRLKIGGKVVRAWAIGQGKALLDSDRGDWQ